MAIRVWKAGDHEIAETILRTLSEPGDELTLEDTAGGSLRWRVLSVEKDPHGWKTTVTRCLPACREHPFSGSATR